MPPKRKKFNSRFPPARVKKIMQTDDEVGKVAASVPILVSKAVEMFMQSLLVSASEQATSKKVKTMSATHMKYCIESERQFDFLRDLVANVSDVAPDEGEGSGTAAPRRRASSYHRSRSNNTGNRTPTHDALSTDHGSSDPDSPGHPAQTVFSPPHSSSASAAKVPDHPSETATIDPLPSAALPSYAHQLAAAGVAMPAAFASQFSAAGPGADDDDDDYDA